VKKQIRVKKFKEYKMERLVRSINLLRTITNISKGGLVSNCIKGMRNKRRLDRLSALNGYQRINDKQNHQALFFSREITREIQMIRTLIKSQMVDRTLSVFTGPMRSLRLVGRTSVAATPSRYPYKLK
jgi:hypothetical protein